MEDRLIVFISSVIASMAAERRAAEDAIRAIPLSRPWVFEHSPASSLKLEASYLSQVRACDIFVLLLGRAVTDPVKAEVKTAQAAGKPILVFLSTAAPADVTQYAQSLGVKYATYQDAADLGQQVAEAVGDELITGYRRHGLARGELGLIGEFLDTLAQGRFTRSSSWRRGLQGIGGAETNLSELTFLARGCLAGILSPDELLSVPGAVLSAA